MNKLLKQPLFIETITLTIVIAVFHWFATINHIYYLVPWIDMVMHTLGGLLISFFVISLLFVRELFGFAHKHHGMVILTTLSMVLLVGLGWELFEVFFDLTAITRIDMIDTLSDLFFDLIGGSFGLWWYYVMIWSRE